jgi:amino acid adenylation domain-containing protein
VKIPSAHAVQFFEPLTPLQRRLWFLQQWSPEDSTYHIADARILHTHLCPEAFQSALQTLVSLLEPLRTTVLTIEGEPQQCVWDEGVVEIVWKDARLWPLSTRQQRLNREANRCLETPFELTQLPLFRVHLWQTGEKEWHCLCVFHHILADPHSIGLFWQGLEALLRHEKLPFDTEWQLADTVSWWQEWQESEEAILALRFWQEHLTPIPPPLQSLTDHPRPQQFPHSSVQHSRVLSPTLLEHTEQWLNERSLTLFSMFSSLVAVVLSKWTRQDCFALATPVDTRVEEEFQDILGPFINTLLLPVSFHDEDSFEQFLQRQHTFLVKALEHRLTPLDELLRVLEVERDPSRPPVAQVLVQMQDERGRQTPSNLSSSPWDRPRSSTGWEWSWTLHCREGQLRVVLERNSELFDDWVAESLLTALETLWQQVLEAPEKELKQYSLCNADQRLLLTRWNQTKRDYPDKTVLQAIAEQCRQSPQAPALLTKDSSLSYADLWKAVESVAFELLQRGVQRGDRVAVMLERGPALPVALLGVWRIGAAYVPILPEWPQYRKLQFLKEAAPVGCLLDPKEALSWDDGWLWSLSLDAVTDVSVPANRLPELAALSGDPLAYVLFTSGSTGRPKGVELGHKALYNRLHWMQEEFGLQAHDRVLQKTPVTFDVAGWELFWPLMVGAVEVLAPPEAHRSPEMLLEVIEEQQITTLHFVPSMLQTFLQSMPPRRATTLKRVIVSGEECTQTLQQHCEESLPQVRLSNLYGPTEAAIDVSCWHCQPGEWPWRIPIGGPIANVELWVMDEQQQWVPPGFPGELVIGGVALAKGYLHAPEKTAERFVSMPGHPEKRLYRTGDLARFRKEGVLEFLGRLDHQFKLRGNRLEAGEVEAALCDFPGILEAAGQLQTEPQPLLIACFVASEEPELAVLRDFLEQRLPMWAVPSGFVRLSTLPRTSSGKVDRKALPHWSPSLHKAEPLTETEERLATLWSELPGMSRPASEDNFFTSGGHSLLAVRLVTEIRKEWGIALSLPAFFRCRSLRELALLVDAQPSVLPLPPLPNLSLLPLCGEPNTNGEWQTGQQKRGWEAPCTPAQQRQWIQQQVLQSSTASIISGALLLQGELQVEALAEAFWHLQTIHSLLRTSFPTRQGTPFQWIHPQPLSHLEQNTASSLEEARQQAQKQTDLPLHLVEGPLLKACLWSLPNQQWLLLLRVHHILVDGESLTLLWKQWQQSYTKICHGVALETKTAAQFTDFAHWQREFESTEHFQEQTAYWQQKLALPLAPQWPLESRKEPVSGDLRGKILPFALSLATTHRLRTLAQQQQVTPYILLLTGIKAWLTSLTGGEDIRIGSPSSWRPLRDVQEMPGLFLNTLILRTDCSGHLSFLQLLRRVQHTVEEAQKHQQLPLEQVFQLLPLKERRLPFRLLFVFQQSSGSEGSFATLQSTPLSLREPEFLQDWSLFVSDDGEKIAGEWQYRTVAFAPGFMERRYQEFFHFLEHCLQRPAHPLSSHPLQSPQELRQLQQWSEPPTLKSRVTLKTTPELFPPMMRQPLPGTAAVVRTTQGQLAPIGIEGELWLAGKQENSDDCIIVNDESLAFSSFQHWQNTQIRAFWSEDGQLHYPTPPPPRLERQEVASEIEKQRDKLQRQLAAGWREVLGVNKVHPEDNFFALGGHSLLALRLISLLRQRLGKNVSLQSLLISSSFEDFAKRVAIAHKEESSSRHGIKARQRTRRTGSITSLGHLRLDKDKTES